MYYFFLFYVLFFIFYVLFFIFSPAFALQYESQPDLSGSGGSQQPHVSSPLRPASTPLLLGSSAALRPVSTPLLGSLLTPKPIPPLSPIIQPLDSVRTGFLF